jgi:hypothetical protein
MEYWNIGVWQYRNSEVIELREMNFIAPLIGFYAGTISVRNSKVRRPSASRQSK